MKQAFRLRARLFAPLVYLAALLLLMEEWFWDTGARLMRALAAWPPLASLEKRIADLPPYGALCLFALPAILLFPVKLLALMAIAHGHAFSGVLVILIAKLGGAAAVARIFFLTRPRLLTIAWFARWHDGFMALKERWIARLRATTAYRYATAWARAASSAWRTLSAPASASACLAGAMPPIPCAWCAACWPCGARAAGCERMRPLFTYDSMHYFHDLNVIPAQAGIHTTSAQMCYGSPPSRG